MRLLIALMFASIAAAAGDALIDGEIFELRDGERAPIAGAWVHARHNQLTVATTRSGPDGRYVLAGLPQGRVVIHVGASGWKTVRAGPRTGNELLFDCSAGGHCGSADFILSRGISVTGRVRDEFGEPAIGAFVTLYRTDTPDRAIGFGGSANVDDRGLYRIPKVLPGEYAIQARIDSMSTDLQGYQYATANNIVKVEDRRENLAPPMVLRLVKKLRVAGRIEGVDDLGPGAHFSVFVNEEIGAAGGNRARSVLGTYLDSEGGFDLRLVPAGTATFWLDRPKPASAEGGGRLFLGAVNLTGDTVDLVLRPGLPARLTGQVVWEGSARQEPIEIRLNRADSDQGRQFSVTPPDYDFDLSDMAPGEYGFWVSDQNSYVREIRAGDKALLEGRVLLKSGDRRNITIVAGSRFARLTGKVDRAAVDASDSPMPAAHYDVLLDRPNSPTIIPTDQFGVFVLEQVIPGKYTICAIRERPAIDWKSGENCAPAAELARKLELEPGAIQEIDLSAR